MQEQQLENLIAVDATASSETVLHSINQRQFNIVTIIKKPIRYIDFYELKETLKFRQNFSL
jgi:hypothetical protein